jgi:hypothetical protein
MRGGQAPPADRIGAGHGGADWDSPSPPLAADLAVYHASNYAIVANPVQNKMKKSKQRKQSFLPGSSTFSVE